METVYIETTVVGHLAGRIVGDLLVSARQRVTREWWRTEGTKFRILISQLVIDECADGDADAASERLDVIKNVELIELTDEVDALANALLMGNAIPLSEPRDAIHIAVAAVNGVDYLLTWNFKHIANASLRGRIEEVCRDAGFEPPIICTPEELMSLEDG